MDQSIKNIAPIGNTNKIKQIIKSLQDYIIEGNLEHGTELPPERMLASHLGVSRFSLREALRVAQAQGLIDITRGRRPRVARPSAEAAAAIISLALRRSRKTFLDLVAARQGLETQIARLAALHANDQQIAEMQQTIKTTEENKNNVDLCVEQDIRFHNILVQATDNVVFEIMLAPLSELLMKSRKETIREGVDRVISGHKSILNAIQAREPEQAAQAMFRHLKMAEEDLEKALPNSL